MDISKIPGVLANEAPIRSSHLQALPLASPTALAPIAPVIDVSNPLHMPSSMDDLPPPPTQTLPAREIYHEATAALRPLMNAVRTQEELEDLLEGLRQVQYVPFIFISRRLPLTMFLSM